MGENGRQQFGNRGRGWDRNYNKNQRRRRSERDDRSNNNYKTNNNNKYDEEMENGELVVYRILCPDWFIKSVIGKLDSIRQDTGAKVKVVDPFPGSKHRVITIYCYVKEKVDIEPADVFDDKEFICVAQGALIRVHVEIVNVVGSGECRILAPSSQSAPLIGTGGAMIKRLRSETHTDIHVSPKNLSDPNHSCAMEFDNFVQITGKPDEVVRALFAVSAIMYKFKPKEDVPLETYVPSALGDSHIQEYQGYADSGNQSPIYSAALPVVSSLASLGYEHRGLGLLSSSSKYAMRESGNGSLPSYGGLPSSASVMTVPGHAVDKAALPVVSGYSGASLSQELIIRVLCPFTKIGRLIGRGIESVREASGAHVDVDDTRRDGCPITIQATESLNDKKSMAVEAVLLLEGIINEEDEGNVSIRLIVPSKDIGCVIGKRGSIINEIRKRTGAYVHISNKPKCADANEELVEVTGEVGSVRDALVQIVLCLRDDVLKDRDSGHNTSSGNDSLYAGGSDIPVPSVLPSVSSLASLGYEHRGLGLFSSSSKYTMRESGYGSLPSYGGLPSSASVMTVPGHAVDKVTGKGGANVDNICKISGAYVQIFDSNSSPGDYVAVISGTHEQKRSAENMIQAFILAT